MNGTTNWRLLLAGAGLAILTVAGCGFSLDVTDGSDGGTGGGELDFVTGTLPVGEQGANYRATIEAAGGVAPYTFARSRGDDWPTGVSLDSDTGVVSGIPAEGSGNAYFVDVTVTDSAELPTTIERRLTLVISETGNEYAAIRAWILPTCFTAACHSAETHASDLVLVDGMAYANLVDQPAHNEMAVAAGKVLVVPGDPDSSYFLQKISGDGLDAGEGTVMPQAGVRLPTGQVDLVRQWIAQGALEPPGEDLSGGGGTGVGEVEPGLEFGQTVEQIYAPLAEGGELEIWLGTQGGAWVRPTLRAVGLDTAITLDASLTSADDGTLIGETSFSSNMTLTLEGTELQNVLIPIFSDLTVEEFFDTEAVLSFDVTDDEGNEASLALTVVLVPA